MRGEVDVQAGQVAFNALFSLGPLVALAAFLLAAVPNPHARQAFAQHVARRLPPTVGQLLQGQLDRLLSTASPLYLAVALGGVLWTLSSAAGSISIALHHVGWPQRDGWFRRRVIAMLLSILFALGLAVSTVATMVGPRFVSGVESFFHLHLPVLHALHQWRWAAVAVGSGLGGAFFLAYGSSVRPRPLATILGALVFAVSAVVVSAGLGFYLEHAPGFTAYGAAATAFATLFWLYLLALVFLVSAALAWVVQFGPPHALGPSRPRRRRKRLKRDSRFRRFLSPAESSTAPASSDCG